MCELSCPETLDVIKANAYSEVKCVCSLVWILNNKNVSGQPLLKEIRLSSFLTSDTYRVVLEMGRDFQLGHWPGYFPLKLCSELNAL